MVEYTPPDERAGGQWSDPRADLDLYLVLASAPHDGATWSPVAWCHNRADALDVAELWAEEFPARVLRRDTGGAVSAHATLDPVPRERRHR